MQFCTANGKTQKGALQAMRTKVHRVFPCQNCACVTRAKADKQANGHLYFCEKQKNFTKSVCNGVKRLERVGKIAVHNVDKKANYKKFQNR